MDKRVPLGILDNTLLPSTSPILSVSFPVWTCALASFSPQQACPPSAVQEERQGATRAEVEGQPDSPLHSVFPSKNC